MNRKDAKDAKLLAVSGSRPKSMAGIRSGQRCPFIIPRTAPKALFQSGNHLRDRSLANPFLVRSQDPWPQI